MVSSAIHAALDTLQFGQVNKFLLFQQVPIGLGGQITGRIDALRLALALGRKAVFKFPNDPPYAQTFDPMHKGEPSPKAWGTAEPLCFSVDQRDRKAVVFDPRVVAVRHNQNQDTILNGIEERIGVHNIDPLVLDGTILRWMKVRPVVEGQVEACKKRLGLSEDTLGVHLRRGDKSVETAFVPSSEVNRQISIMHRKWQFNSVYLASDSPRAPDEIRLPDGVKMIFDAEEVRYDNANHKMLMASPDLAAQETMTAYKNIALLSSCGGIIGQDNAHFATLAAAAIAERRSCADTISLIDGRLAENGSVGVRYFFLAKRWARKSARSALPWLTIDGRMRRKKNKS